MSVRPHHVLFLVLVSLAGCRDRSRSNDTSTKELDAIAQIYKQGDAKTAVEKLKGYLKSNPRDDLAWTILGNAHEDLEENAEAEAAYAKAIEVNPKAFKALTGMGILYRKKGDYAQALAYYEKALAIDPKYAEAYSSMSVIALKQQKDEKALEYAKKAYDLDKTSATIVANLAVVYHYNGMIELRDKMTEDAKKLGYKSLDRLQKIYSGELTLRD
jgi:tetratricopeptide (TPR) repeat protein